MAQSESAEPAKSTETVRPLIQDFTAYTLKAGQVKIGLVSSVGITDSIQIDTDVFAASAGAANLSVKTSVWSNNRHRLAVGLGMSYLSKKTALWGNASELFDELEYKIFRPQMSWTQKISKRLLLHSFWSTGIGPISVKLSDKGRKKLWESKYPDGDYDKQTKSSSGTADDDANVESNNVVSHRTLQVQSLLGLSRDIIQVSGEFVRDSTKRVILTSRIDRTELEGLSSQGIRVTAGQEWQIDSFFFRLGLGVLYQVLDGTDLDGEVIDDSGFTPIADLDFYWIF